MKLSALFTCLLAPAIAVSLAATTALAQANQTRDPGTPFWMQSDQDQLKASEVSSSRKVAPDPYSRIPNIGPVSRTNSQPVQTAGPAAGRLGDQSDQQLPGGLPTGDLQQPGLQQDNPLILPGTDFQGDPDGDLFADRPPIPKQLVESQFSGWEQAGPGFDAQRLDRTLRANWVMTDQIGRLPGRVLNFQVSDQPEGQPRNQRGMQVFLIRRGATVVSDFVAGDGSFMFTGVKEGCYTIVGSSAGTFFAFGVNIIAYDELNPAPQQLVIAAAPSPVRFNAAWAKTFAPLVRMRNFGVYEEQQGPEDPAKWYGIEGITDQMPQAAAATSIYNHRVAPLADGRVVGRVHQIDSLDGRPVDVGSTRLLLVQGTEIVTHTTADNFGVFEFIDVAPGSYSLLAASDDGLAALGIEVVEQVADGAINSIDFALANAEATGWINHYLTEEDYLDRVLAPRNKKRDCNCNNYNVQQLLAASRERFKYGCLTDNREFHARCQGRNGNGGCGNPGCNSCGNGTCSACGQTGCQGQCGTMTDCQQGNCGQSNCLSCQQNNYDSRLGAAFRRCEDCDQQQGGCAQCQNQGQNLGTCNSCGNTANQCQCGGGNR